MNSRTLRIPSPNSLAATIRQPELGVPRGASRPSVRAGAGSGSSSIGWSFSAIASGGVVTATLVSLEVAQVDLVQLVTDPAELPDAHPPGGQVDRDVAPDRLGTGHVPELWVVRVAAHLDHAGDRPERGFDLIGRAVEPDLELELVAGQLLGKLGHPALGQDPALVEDRDPVA